MWRNSRSVGLPLTRNRSAVATFARFTLDARAAARRPLSFGLRASEWAPMYHRATPTITTGRSMVLTRVPQATDHDGEQRPRAVPDATRHPTMRPRVLNVGGGNKAIPIPAALRETGIICCSTSTRAANPDVVCDARELDSLEANQFDAIYCSHNLELNDGPCPDKGFPSRAGPGRRIARTGSCRRGQAVVEIGNAASESGPAFRRSLIRGYALSHHQIGTWPSTR